MVIKYTSFVIFLLLVVFSLSFVFKPAKIERFSVSDYKDPLKSVRNVYAKLVWRDFSEKKNPEEKFNIITRVLDYDPTFMPAYKALCDSSAEYIKANISIKDFMKLVQNGIDKFGNQEFVECYIGTMIGMDRYPDAIEYLKKEEVLASDDKKEFYETRIKQLQGEKNVLDLTKAVEGYYQKYKNYPGDILVLVNEKFIETIPEDPFGGQYFISKQGQIRTTSSKEDVNARQ